MGASARNPDVTKRLLAVGCPLPQNDASELQPTLLIEIRNSEVSRICDYQCHVEYVLDLRLTNRSYAEIVISRYKCRPPWPDPYFTFITDPTKDNKNFEHRSSMGMPIPEVLEATLPSGRRFYRADVLNDRKGESGKIKPGECLEGVLLAWGMYASVPGDYLHGHPAFVEITVVDQYERRHGSTIEVLVDRSATMPVIRKLISKGLFEDDDEVEDGVYVPGQQVTPTDILRRQEDNVKGRS
jgi:hypothetical protein